MYFLLLLSNIHYIYSFLSPLFLTSMHIHEPVKSPGHITNCQQESEKTQQRV